MLMFPGMWIILNLDLFQGKIKPILIVTLLLLTACGDPNAQSSSIVRQLEAAGAGNVASLTEPEISDWLARHNDRTLIARLNGECQPLRSRADASWTYRTAEGRICKAVASLDVPPRVPVDHSQFGNVPGVK
jgi:hypothetical protein